MFLPWRWDIWGPGSILIGFAQAPRHLTSISPACLFLFRRLKVLLDALLRLHTAALAFVSFGVVLVQVQVQASLPKLTWAIENVGYGGKLEVLLATCALVLYSASAVAETEGIKTLMGKTVKNSRDYTAQWPIEQGPWTPPVSWMRERQFVLGRMRALLAPAITRK